mgnify:CR=1 FL=1|tara:strand:+ start:1222 stop:1449 length:228 start_codon:yes stop_codon:yes gene_type:complete
MKLREHQKNAVHLSIENNFSSGVLFHATGTGKSWVALDILINFKNKVENNKVSLQSKRKPLHYISIVILISFFNI